ncbi:uncharacterized protein LOC116433931 isoform X2 [Nomia melanderi]|uniref:uncharacterized protein LOC116433931 isoform X2 n=1 Tax=Nomia melanderi TaxID=2448451 RepID=UPI0013045DCB|nr:chromatin assembly factor 1 subunit A-A isoform X2 [Nomia melanderi]
MKMMELDEQDDCYIDAITPVKKKKMKQAQLPFQRSPVGSPQVVLSKKRKLTSPSVEYKSPKAIKISKKNVRKPVVNNKKVNDIVSDEIKENSETIKDTEVMEIENVKENTISNKVESGDKNVTPKRVSKKLEKEKAKLSPLISFFKKTEKEAEAEASKDDQNLSQEERNESSDKSSDLKTDNISSELTNSKQEELNDSKNLNNDSDILISSSDSEDKEELTMLNGSQDSSRKSISPSEIETPKTDKGKQRKLTPKQQEKKLLSAKKREEKKKLRMEKERKLEEERENRRKEKEEKRREKEEKEKAEKEQKMLEKKLRDQKKQLELEQKQKEKQAKEEERRKREEAKEEEKRKKEEEKLEAERKKQKAASNFTSFFVAKKQEKTVEEESTNKIQNFMPFEVKVDMRLAPVCRRSLNEQEKKSLDESYNKENVEKSDLYLSNLRNKKIIPHKSSKTWPFEAKDDIILLDDENDGSSNIVNQNVIENQRAKLLQFSENRRPPYWGTWRKRSKSINPRKPFSKDEKCFNYEVDSDDEWEEEEPGESLHGSDDEKDEENPDDNEYDVDNEFMVPHGYLSDEELRADEEDKEDRTPETQKFKLKVLGEQFESERNTKTSKLKPKIIGCVWRGPENTFSENVPPRTIGFLSAREAWVRQIPVLLPTSSDNDAAAECSTPTHQSVPRSSKKSLLPEQALPELIRLIHGNTHGRRFLMREFMTYWNKKHKVGENQISKGCLLQKICELGKRMLCPEEGPMHLKSCWYVPEDIRKKYLDKDLTLPNQWSYNLTPRRRREKAEDEKVEEEKDKEKKNVPLITQFTKKISQAEMKKQLTVAANSITPQKKITKTPKRATLISVGRGEQFSKASKENLLKKFVKRENEVDKNVKENIDDDRNDDIVIIDDIENDQQKNWTVTEEKTEAVEIEVVTPMECENESKGTPTQVLRWM